ncbi:hypothetical protein F5I97DRAFT_1507949 [Phlebopus sp. FC_14]|nr:hypothetical protein F5I97DRAFT_1507949 [Phlebopus sp. FC_14]
MSRRGPAVTRMVLLITSKVAQQAYSTATPPTNLSSSSRRITTIPAGFNGLLVSRACTFSALENGSTLYAPLQLFFLSPPYFLSDLCFDRAIIGVCIRSFRSYSHLLPFLEYRIGSHSVSIQHRTDSTVG